MSKSFIKKTKCPYCGNEQDQIIYASINVELNPENYLKTNPPTNNLSITGLHKSHPRRYLDSEEIFNKWVELGDSGRLYEYYVKSGFVSPHTNRPPSERMLFVAAFRYITVSLEDSLNKLLKAYKDAGEDISEDTLIDYLVERLPEYVTPRYYIKFIIENKLYEEHFNIIPKRMGLGDHQYQSMLKSEGSFNAYRFYEGTLPQRVLDRVTRLKPI